jgi:hypothetical protein
MKRLALIALFVATACGQSDRSVQSEQLSTFDVAEAPPPPEVQAPGLVAPEQAPERTEQAAAAPQIAYTYSFGYRVAADDVAAVQRAHVALCDRLGPARCRIASMTRDSGDGRFVQAGLTLLVDARIARQFADRLDAAVSGAGGEVSQRGIQAEDLSKQIVDTEARMRGKEALAQRLLALLGSRQGKVGELVEAERAYAQAQEELDAARSWLAEMRGRVAQSRLEISYTSERPAGGGFWQPVRDAFREAGQVLGASLAALVTVTVALLPWVLLLALLVWLLRRLGWLQRLRWPRRRRTSEASTPPT